MSNDTNGASPGKDAPEKESAGGCNTTTADTNNAPRTIAFGDRITLATARIRTYFGWIASDDAFGILLIAVNLWCLWELLA